MAASRDRKTDWIDLETLFAPNRPTLGEVPQWYELGGHCWGCEREGGIDRWQLQQSVGPDAHLYTLRQFLRCRNCGNKGTNTWMLGSNPATPVENLKGILGHHLDCDVTMHRVSRDINSSKFTERPAPLVNSL